MFASLPRRLVLLLSGAAAAIPLELGTCNAQTVEPAPLRLESTIPLGAVAGRIDHLAIDLPRHRLFVAQLGDDTVSVVDLDAQRVTHVIRELKEPQGVAYVGLRDTLYVANGGDGSVRLFQGSDYKEVGRIELGDDADNIRLDVTGTRTFIGYAGGKLAEVDTVSRSKVGDTRLKAHPESFQIDPSTSHAFVNVPAAKEIAVVDYAARRQVASWPVTDDGNFPMALDPANRRVIVVFRNPAMFAAYSMPDGKPVARIPTCGDADDVFVDAGRRRVYISCGEGAIDVLQAQADRYGRLARIPTFPGARTSLFVPELDRLYVAARATPEQQASILVFKADQ